MKHYGDITKLDGYSLPPVDIITGGSPCQDLSVAGKREGLAGERSGLFMEQIRVIKEMRENDRRNGRTGDLVRPRYMVWENVPGAFSSNRGEDFRAVLEETARVADETAVIPGLAAKQKWSSSGAILGDGWSIAWRVHDAQFWGVPQRRKRISLVADFGGPTAPEILFERESVSGDLEPGAEEREEAAGAVEGSPGTASYGTGGNNQPIVVENPSYQRTTGSLMASGYSKLGTQEAANDMYVVQSQSWDGTQIAPTLTSNNAGGNQRMPDKDNFNAVVQSLETYHCTAEVDKVQTLMARDYKDPQVVTYGLDRASFNQGKNAQYDFAIEEEKIATQVAKGPGAVCTAVDCRNGTEDTDVNASLQSASAHNLNSNNVCRQNSVVRRLTPLECERLQGFPDGWTDIFVERTVTVKRYDVEWIKTEKCEYSTIQGAMAAHYAKVNTENPDSCDDYDLDEYDLMDEYDQDDDIEPFDPRDYGFRKKKTLIGSYEEVQRGWFDSKGKWHKEADSPRYKALGNSIALPFWHWLLRRISAQYVGFPTLGSLFDGIGGFPLCWERINGKGTALWASEIEEFPIAVTKIHFPEKE